MLAATMLTCKYFTLPSWLKCCTRRLTADQADLQLNRQRCDIATTAPYVQACRVSRLAYKFLRCMIAGNDIAVHLLCITCRGNQSSPTSLTHRGQRQRRRQSGLVQGVSALGPALKTKPGWPTMTWLLPSRLPLRACCRCHCCCLPA